MTATILKTSVEKLNIEYHKNINEIKIVNLINPLCSPTVSETITNVDNFLKFVSPRKKIFISLDPNYYHFHNDSLGILFGYYEIIKDCIFVLDISQIVDYQNCLFYNFFIEFLKNNSIEYELINCSKDTVIHANNFFIVRSFPNTNINAPQLVFNFYKNSIDDLKIKPYKKVYLSRKDNRGLTNSNQINEYFKNNGFEIIYAEDFANFKEQINYFYKVKTLASVSGAGLTNSIFMQENTSVVEILTPHTLDIFLNGTRIEKSVQQLHHVYNVITFLKNQKYIGIPNINNNAEDIINKLNSLEIIK